MYIFIIYININIFLYELQIYIKYEGIYTYTNVYTYVFIWSEPSTYWIEIWGNSSIEKNFPNYDSKYRDKKTKEINFITLK